MKRLFVQSSIVIFLASILMACQSGGEDVVLAEPIHVFEPLPVGLPVFTEIDIPFFGRIEKDPTDPEDLGDDEGSLSLFSFSESDTVGNAGVLSRILESKSGITVSLALRDSSGNSFDASMLVSNDSVFKVDHANNEVRLLNHFVNKVCEVIPAKSVQTSSPDASTGQITHTVFNEDFVYVVTVEGSGSALNCASSTNKKRFYKLPLNFQFDATDSNTSKTSELEIVSESLVRAELLFGWGDDGSGGKELIYGYLGYSQDEEKLVFYDSNRQVHWSQARTLNTFPVVETSDDTFSPEILFNLVELESQQYMLQLGQDIFVFDSSAEIFAKAFNETNSILTDRNLKIGLSTIVIGDTTSDIIVPITAMHDSDELLMIDDSKIFKFDYTANLSAIAEAPLNTILRLPVLNIALQNHLDYMPFSQFDNLILACQKDNNPSDCNAAHDLLGNSWQFITACTAALGCNVDILIDDLCETYAEKLVTQSDETLCSPDNYQHLSELNTSANDAEFRGYMQYNRSGADYIQGLDYILHENSLFITARLNEKEILLRYFYQKDFTDPTQERERVLFGERVKHFGLDAYILNNSLFLTSLLSASIRSNECYKNYQHVNCDIGELVEDGVTNTCTGADLQSTDKNKVCFNRFTEFNSKALFCSKSQLDNNLCSDNQLIPVNLLSVEGPNENAKWLPLSDLSQTPVGELMYLLLAPQSIPSSTGATLSGEGVLVDPELFLVDDVTGLTVGSSNGTLKGQVESVVDAWFFKDSSLGYLNVISNEVKQVDGTGSVEANNSVVNKYMMNLNSLNGSVDALQNSADLLSEPVSDAKNIEFEFKRPVTLK